LSMDIGDYWLYRTMQLKKWARYDLIIEISNYAHGFTKLHTRRKSELMVMLIELESKGEEE